MLAARIGITLLAAGYLFASTMSGLDRLSAQNSYLERSVVAPFRAEADRAATAIHLADRDAASALASARAAVSRDPVDPGSAAALGSALLLAGEGEGAARAYRVAAMFGWRDAATQAYWYDAALQNGDYKVAAERIDALLRAHPAYAADPRLLENLERDAAGREALATRIAARPAWLANYLLANEQTGGEVLARKMAVLSLVPGRAGAFDCETIAPMVAALVDAGRRSEAEGFWNRHCPERKVGGLVADPTFAGILSPAGKAAPIGWRGRASGDLLLRREGEGPEGVLVAENRSQTQRLAAVQQVAFAPGTYELRLETDRAAPGAVAFTMGCGQPPPYPRGIAGDAVGQGQRITVGECAPQTLGLWLAPRAAVRIRALRAEPAS